MHRSALLTASLAVAMMMGCSSPVDTEAAEDDFATTGSALSRCGDYYDDYECNCDGPSRKAFTLTAINGNTVSGVNGFGQTITATFTSSTKFRLANLNRFTPSEPIRPVLVAYNTAVKQGTNVIDTMMEDLVSFDAQARISVKTKGGTTTVYAFRPVP